MIHTRVELRGVGSVGLAISGVASLKVGDDECFLGAERLVQGGFRDPRFGEDAVDSNAANTLSREEGARGVEEAVGGRGERAHPLMLRRATRS